MIFQTFFVLRTRKSGCGPKPENVVNAEIIPSAILTILLYLAQVRSFANDNLIPHFRYSKATKALYNSRTPKKKIPLPADYFVFPRFVFGYSGAISSDDCPENPEGTTRICCD